MTVIDVGEVKKTWMRGKGQGDERDDAAVIGHAMDCEGERGGESEGRGRCKHGKMGVKAGTYASDLLCTVAVLYKHTVYVFHRLKRMGRDVQRFASTVDLNCGAAPRRGRATSGGQMRGGGWKEGGRGGGWAAVCCSTRRPPAPRCNGN